ncbi:TraB/VirB10 family protein [Methylomonas sp. AM2-LC]|uniref:TraB/VirB10 family protein n=1 Tax=Methylomonas sp. AM2-LC TaxID=3153301 RepID=UPI0032665349
MLDFDKNKSIKGAAFQWYEMLEPSKKKMYTLIGIACGILIVSYLFIYASESNNGPKKFTPKRKVEYSIFNGKNPRNLSVEAMSGQLKRLSNDFSDMKRVFQHQEEENKAVTELVKAQSEAMNKRTESLSKLSVELQGQINDAKESFKNSVVLPEVPIDGGNRQGAKDVTLTKNPLKNDVTLQGSKIGEQSPTLVQNSASSDQQTGPRIRVVTSGGEEGKKGQGGNQPADPKKTGEKRIVEFVNVKSSSSKGGAPDMFLPAGSILSGTLITGLDAPTSNQARKDPFPALLRIKNEAILPNHYRMDIRECFLIASGYGDLSSERAYMRAERISCIKNDGVVIETSMDAYSVGEDGKAGIRGRLISKNGQIIGNALLSGFVAGITHAFAPQQVTAVNTNSTSGGQQPFLYPSPGMLAGQGAMGGIQGASQQIAGYYLAMARNIFPIIEVDAGRKIDFIMVRGLSLNPKPKQSENGHQQSGQQQQSGTYRMAMPGGSITGDTMQMPTSNLNAIGPIGNGGVNSYSSMFGGSSGSYGYNGGGTNYSGGGGYFSNNNSLGGNMDGNQ